MNNLHPLPTIEPIIKAIGGYITKRNSIAIKDNFRTIYIPFEWVEEEGRVVFDDRLSVWVKGADRQHPHWVQSQKQLAVENTEVQRAIFGTAICSLGCAYDADIDYELLLKNEEGNGIHDLRGSQFASIADFVVHTDIATIAGVKTGSDGSFFVKNGKLMSTEEIVEQMQVAA